MDEQVVDRNPITGQRNRIDGFWQILFPVMLIAILFVIPLALLLIGRYFEELAAFTDYIIILVVLGLVISSFPIMLLIISLNGFLKKGAANLPVATFKGQGFFIDARDKADKVTDQFAQKIIQTRSLKVGLTTTLGYQSKTETGPGVEMNTDNEVVT